jgi:hypothetical protein
LTGGSWLVLEAQMQQVSVSVNPRLKTPHAAAIAGLLFSILSITSHLLIRSAVPQNPLGSYVDIIQHMRSITLALNLVPFAGISFLWFIAVVRDRLGKMEDRFFATVLLGSGLLYIAMFFASAAIAGGVIRVLTSGAENLIASGSYALGRAEVYQISNIYGIKMAGVFMFTSATVVLRTGILPKWFAILGYGLGLLLLLSVGIISWTPTIFPLWVLLISTFFLIEKRPTVTLPDC